MNKFSTELLKLAEEKNSANTDKATEIKKKGLYYCKILINYIENSFFSGQVDTQLNKHGKGFLLKNDGSKYTGTWVNNKFEGQGTFIDSDGTLHEGEFKKNLLNGQGKKISFDNNYSYIGSWKENNKSGIGSEETSEYIYTGNFENNKKQGKGKFFLKILNENYEGEFTEDEITGNGTYLWSNKDIYTGELFESKMNGKGVYRWPDGSEYKGDYILNVKEGFGEYKMKDNKIYRGPFINGKPEGKGTLEINGKINDVEFVNGKLKKDDNKKKKKKF